jgi:hypothetical protein
LHWSWRSTTRFTKISRRNSLRSVLNTDTDIWIKLIKTFLDSISSSSLMRWHTK